MLMLDVQKENSEKLTLKKLHSEFFFSLETSDLVTITVFSDTVFVFPYRYIYHFYKFYFSVSYFRMFISLFKYIFLDHNLCEVEEMILFLFKCIESVACVKLCLQKKKLFKIQCTIQT